MTRLAIKVWELIQTLPREDISFLRERLIAASEEEENRETSNVPAEQTYHEAIKPIRKTTSVEELMEEQQYEPIRKEDFYQKVAELNIEEPLEDLLAMLD